MAENGQHRLSARRHDVIVLREPCGDKFGAGDPELVLSDWPGTLEVGDTLTLTAGYVIPLSITPTEPRTPPAATALASLGSAMSATMHYQSLNIDIATVNETTGLVLARAPGSACSTAFASWSMRPLCASSSS